MRPAGSGNMQKKFGNALAGSGKLQKNFRDATGRFRQNSYKFRNAPAGSGKSQKIHSTCPGVFQIDRNLQQIHLRAMSLGLC